MSTAGPRPPWICEHNRCGESRPRVPTRLAVDPRVAGTLAGCSRHYPSVRIAPPLGAAQRRKPQAWESKWPPIQCCNRPRNLVAVRWPKDQRTCAVRSKNVAVAASLEAVGRPGRAGWLPEFPDRTTGPSWRLHPRRSRIRMSEGAGRPPRAGREAYTLLNFRRCQVDGSRALKRRVTDSRGRRCTMA
jgi:hypothetical protein